MARVHIFKHKIRLNQFKGGWETIIAIRYFPKILYINLYLLLHSYKKNNKISKKAKIYFVNEAIISLYYSEIEKMMVLTLFQF